MSSRRLNSKQQRALEALLVGASDQQAADAAGVTRPTVMGWRNKSLSFRAALAEARAELWKRTMMRLHAATSVAVRALEEIAKDAKHPSRVSAAKTILEQSQKVRGQEELEDRLTKLEARVNTGEGPPK
jgi:ParB-like chromosome segregation protein Spo0J